MLLKKPLQGNPARLFCAPMMNEKRAHAAPGVTACGNHSVDFALCCCIPCFKNRSVTIFLRLCGHDLEKRQISKHITNSGNI
jgi:hypothetical protein